MIDDIKTRLLDAAQLLVQTRGHNGYSYRDLAEQVGIRTASIHYHFPTKTDLTVALIRRYRAGLADAMSQISADKIHLADRLEAVSEIFRGILRNNSRVCLAGALAGEHSSLPEEVKAELTNLIADGQKGIERFLAEGQASGEIPQSYDPAGLARLWFSALQGGLAMARATTSDVLADVTQQLKYLTVKTR